MGCKRIMQWLNGSTMYTPAAAVDADPLRAEREKAISDLHSAKRSYDDATGLLFEELTSAIRGTRRQKDG